MSDETAETASTEPTPEKAPAVMTASQKKARAGWVNQTLILITDRDFQSDQLTDGEKEFVRDLKERAAQGNYKREAPELGALVAIAAKLGISRSAVEVKDDAPVCKRWDEQAKRYRYPY